MILINPGWIGPKGEPWQAILGIGMACAVTALPILMLLMDRLAILRTPLGQRVLRYASLDDIAIWAVLAIILLDWSRMERQLGFICVFPVLAWAVRMAMRRLAEPERLRASMVWLAAAGLLHRLGHSDKTGFADRFIDHVLERHFDPASGLLLTIRGEDKLLVLSASDLSIIREVKTHKQPHGVAYRGG